MSMPIAISSHKQLSSIVNAISGVQFQVQSSRRDIRGCVCYLGKSRVHVNGPFLAGTTDIQMFGKKLKELIPEGRKVVADQGASNCCVKHSSLLLKIHLTLTFFNSNFLSTKEKEA